MERNVSSSDEDDCYACWKNMLSNLQFLHLSGETLYIQGRIKVTIQAKGTFMKYARDTALAAIAVFVWFAPVASAATIAHFEVNGPTPSSYSNFDIPLTPTVTSFTANSFEIDGVLTNLFSSVFGPYSGPLNYTFFVFNPKDYPSGGFTGRYYSAGEQLFSGPASMPTFLPGEYDLYNPNYSMLTSDVVITTYTTAPELTTWAMLIVGFSAVGAVVRKGRSRQRIRLA